ncbi:YhfN [Erythrobacter sp. NAP1]|uniref:M48 family metalloprotease n=1 Tax=Erythrobacter sp. NAP1 TaxID=237727 RepID=UPI0000687687|nr:M48 family metalloprotease [Erythrobacter sp. NAP1]EAQ28150.1 YhfN [Erythrobacter sp. NAP1]
MTFDPEAATRDLMSTLSAEELELARAYTTSNHWLILAGLVVSALVTWLVIKSGVLDWVFSKVSEKWQNLRVFVVAFVFGVVSGLLSLPYSIYTDWYRESAYDRTSQPLGDFLAQGALGMVISSILLSLLFIGVYALIRKTGRLWWLWSGGLVAAFTALALAFLPPLIEPLFNEFEPIPEGEVRDAVLALGAEADISPDRIFMYDGSRQSNNFTANVSGIGGSARIAISDVAMGEASLDEVKAVTGHEIGHYVLGHVWRSIFVLSVMAVLVFFLTAKSYDWFARKFGSSAELSDVRGIPVLLFIMGLFFTLGQPVINTMTRIGEREADAYSLRTVNLPDALSMALIKTAEYRYPLAGDLEEAIFYTHPTVQNRVRAAMEWKADNMDASETE